MLNFTNTWCDQEKQYRVWGKILYQENKWVISYISPYTEENKTYNGMKEWSVVDISLCQSTLSISTNQTNRYYVQDNTGQVLENKIREGKMYAKWKIAKNGFIMFEDIVEESEIK
jgi:hypothetical protein